MAPSDLRRTPPTTKPAAARRKTVLAPADQVVLAFGGLGDGNVPLDTVVMFDRSQGAAEPLLTPPARMSARPRRPHRHHLVGQGQAGH